MVGDGAFSHKIDCNRTILEILNLKGHLNRNIGSKVTAILLNRWVLPIGGVAWGRVCTWSLHNRLVFFFFFCYFQEHLVLHCIASATTLKTAATSPGPAEVHSK